MKTSKVTPGNTEGTRIERVTVEGVDLYVTVTTTLCNDGILRDMADQFIQVIEDGCRISLALSSRHVSQEGVRDALLASLHYSTFSD